MTIKFERLSLYEEVWTTPLTKLGKKYGLSDNGVRKICIALNIPLPKAGHWTKIAAGHQIKRPPLPEQSDKTEFISNPKPLEIPTPELEADHQWLAERNAFESNSLNRITVDLNPEKIHRLLSETHRQLKAKIKEYANLKINAEQELSQRPGKRWAPRLNWMSWEMFVNAGQLITIPTNGVPLRVSESTGTRTLAILNALLLNAETRGFKIVKIEKDNVLGLQLLDETIRFRVSEKVKDEFQKRENPSALEQHLGDKRIKVPTGILRIYVSTTGYDDACISDSENMPLENRLNEIFQKIYKVIVTQRENKRKWAERDRQYAENRRVREEQEKLKQQEIKKQEEEAALRVKLLDEASNWKSAQLIRDYIAHLDSHSQRENPDYMTWKSWAINVANELDPTQKRVSNQV